MLLPVAACAGLHVAAPLLPGQLYRGDPVIIEFQLDVDTSLEAFQFTPDYERFADILELAEDPRLAPEIASGTGLCYAGACSYFYLPPRLVPEGTVAARWKLYVKSDAPIGPFAFDLDLLVNGERIGFPQGVRFSVVPEQPIWLLVIAALVAAGVRRLATGRGLETSMQMHHSGLLKMQSATRG